MVCGKCIRIHRTRGLGVCREVEVYAQLYHGGRAKEEAEVLWWMWLYWLDLGFQCLAMEGWFCSRKERSREHVPCKMSRHYYCTGLCSCEMMEGICMVCMYICVYYVKSLVVMEKLSSGAAPPLKPLCWV